MLDNELFVIFKEFVWVPAIAAIGWAWKHNEDEHKEHRKNYKELSKNASESQSSLNNRLMAHVDERFNEALRTAREEDKRIFDELYIQRGHIAKLFDKLEEHARRSEDRHLEMLTAIHSGLDRKADK